MRKTTWCLNIFTRWVRRESTFVRATGDMWGSKARKIKACISLCITGWQAYDLLTSFWGTCARTEGGVLIYLSKQSDDQRPRTLMSQGGKFAEAAVVAAPIRKLCPSNLLECRSPLLIRSLISLVSFSRDKNPPDTVMFWSSLIQLALSSLIVRLVCSLSKISHPTISLTAHNKYYVSWGSGRGLGGLETTDT